MSRKQYLVLIVILVTSQLVTTLFFYKQGSSVESETLSVPVQQVGSSNENNTASTLYVAKIRLPTEEALRKIIRSALQKELQTISVARPIVNVNEQMSISSDGGLNGSTGIVKNPVDPTVRESAMMESEQVIDLAITAGMWSMQDNIRLQKNASKLDESQKIKLIEKIGDAMERGELRLEQGAFPVF